VAVDPQFVNEFEELLKSNQLPPQNCISLGKLEERTRAHCIRVI